MDTEAEPVDQVITVPLADLRPSPTNPRKHGLLDRIDELAESIKAVGLLQPIVAREAPGAEGYEVVFGHRRREAAIRAGFAGVPILVREYTDDQVLEAQTVENLQRTDVHPLDEADGFAVLLKRGYDVPKVAGKIGKPVSYVVQRLKLCALSKACRKALDDGHVTLGVALELAKLPTEKLQSEGLKAVAASGKEYDARDRGLMTVADARVEIEREVMRKLENAPFDTTDAALVPAAGACTTCPKRTGVQVDLFPDASSPDLCSDPTCFRSKSDAKWKALQKTAKAEGKRLLPVAEVKTVFDEYGSGRLRYNAPYVPLAGSVRNDAGRDVSVKGLFKGEEPEITVARNPHTGDVVELVPKKVVDRLLSKRKRQTAHEERTKKTPAQKAADAKATATAERERAKEQAKITVNERCVAAVADVVEKAGARAETYVLGLVLDSMDGIVEEAGARVLQRRGIAAKGKGRTLWGKDVIGALRGSPNADDPAWLRGVVAEIALSEFIEFAYGENKNAIEKACKTWGVDRKGIEAAVIAEQKAEKEAPKTDGQGKGKKPAKAERSPGELDDVDFDDEFGGGESDAPARPKPKVKPKKKAAKKKGGRK